jgi:PAS domain-containing protein
MPVECDISLIEDITDNTIGYISIIKDITKQKEAEEKIKSLARFPAENPEPVFRVNKEGVVLYANEASNELVHQMTKEPVQKTHQFITDIVKCVLITESSKTVEFNLHDRTWSFLFAYVKTKDYVNIYAKDVTEQKQALQALKESEELFHSISDSVIDAVVLVDESDVVIYWNPALKKSTVT